MSRVYIALLALSAFLISAIGATFSIVGLTALFAGAPLTIGFMAGSLEFAKLVTAGFLYRYWGHVNRLMRSYLSAAVVTLSLITSMGIFGYLSSAYQKSALAFKTQSLELEALKQQDARLNGEIKRIEKFIEEVPKTHLTKKFELYEESRFRIKSLIRQSSAIQKQMADLNLKMLTTQTDVGPLMYVAEMFHTEVDKVARILIIVFVSVFDPLAICLVFALGLAIRLKEKYRGDEAKISKNAISKPVDHRFRRVS